jgi:hypothetical protein
VQATFARLAARPATSSRSIDRMLGIQKVRARMKESVTIQFVQICKNRDIVSSQIGE